MTSSISAVPTAVGCSPSVTHVGTVRLHGVEIVSLLMNGQERLCLAQISNTLLKDYSYNEIHNRRVALGITCVQCTPVQLEILRRAGAMPVSSRRCGMITRREAERLVKSFLEDSAPPKLPDDFAFDVEHSCGWGCRGAFVPSRYNSSRAKCIRCRYCDVYFSPNKFIFHYHRSMADSTGAVYNHPDAANFNSWRRHLKLVPGGVGTQSDSLLHAWEDVKAMFNGGNRRRVQQQQHQTSSGTSPRHSTTTTSNIFGNSNGSSDSHRHHPHHSSHHLQQQQQQHQHQQLYGGDRPGPIRLRTLHSLRPEKKKPSPSPPLIAGSSDSVVKSGSCGSNDAVISSFVRPFANVVNLRANVNISNNVTGYNEVTKNSSPPSLIPSSVFRPPSFTSYPFPPTYDAAIVPVATPNGLHGDQVPRPDLLMTSVPISEPSTNTVVRPEPKLATAAATLPFCCRQLIIDDLVPFAADETCDDSVVSVSTNNNNNREKRCTLNRMTSEKIEGQVKFAKSNESGDVSDCDSDCSIDVDTVDDDVITESTEPSESTATAAAAAAAAAAVIEHRSTGDESRDVTTSSADSGGTRRRQLEYLLQLEMQARHALELNYKQLNERLALEADTERRHRLDLEKQLQLVKDSHYPLRGLPLTSLSVFNTPMMTASAGSTLPIWPPSLLPFNDGNTCMRSAVGQMNLLHNETA